MEDCRGKQGKIWVWSILTEPEKTVTEKKIGCGCGLTCRYKFEAKLSKKNRWKFSEYL